MVSLTKNREEKFCITFYVLTGAILRQTAYQSQSNLNYFIANANCTGDEENLLNCSYSIMNTGLSCNFEAGVVCQGKNSMQMHVKCLTKLNVNLIINDVTQ